MIRPIDLISPQYVALQQQLHAHPRGYGGKGAKWADTVLWLCERYACTSVLDYGCGQGSLKTGLLARQPSGLRVGEYDPAIPGKDGLPVFADLVNCTDVLEHIEHDRLDTVLRHLRLLARKVVFLVVNLRPAGKWLSDGRNAHLIVESAEWWRARVEGTGLRVLDVPDLPLKSAMRDPEKRAKAWIAVAQP